MPDNLFTSADLAALLSFANTNTHGMALDLDEPQEGAAPDDSTAHLGHPRLGLWSIRTTGDGYTLHGFGGPEGFEWTASWSRPVSSVIAGLAIISSYAARLSPLLEALDNAYTEQVEDAVAAGGDQHA